MEFWQFWFLEKRLYRLVSAERERLNSIKEESGMRDFYDRHYDETFTITKEELLNERWVDLFKALKESVDDQSDLYPDSDEVVVTPGIDEGTKKMIDTLYHQFYDEVIGRFTDPVDALVFDDPDRMLYKAKKWYDGWNDRRYKEYITFLTVHEILYRSSLTGKPSQSELIRRLKSEITVTGSYTDFYGTKVTFKQKVKGWDIGDKKLRLIYQISDDRLLSLMYTFGYTLDQLSLMLPFLKNNGESKRLDIMSSVICGALNQHMSPVEIVDYIVNSCETDGVYLEGYIERRNREIRNWRDLL